MIKVTCPECGESWILPYDDPCIEFADGFYVNDISWTCPDCHAENYGYYDRVI